MLHVSEIMTGVHVIQPDESLRQAATLMQELDIGAMPVCDGLLLLGMVTDRDIAIYGVAEGLNADEACVSDVMSEDTTSCSENQDAEEAMRIMEDRQLRRLPVVDKDRNVVGMLSISDLAEVALMRRATALQGRDEAHRAVF